ncbi:MAG: antitoxin family protein [Acidobacteriota bacterium]|nr:antitoxin family protein [Acidobacteriota bacterium]
MNQNIQAIYENGILRPLQPLDLPENKTVNITVLDETSNGEETHRDKVSRVLREAGLTSPLKFPVTEKDILSEEERQRLGKLFSGEKSLSDYIDEDREARG